MSRKKLASVLLGLLVTTLALVYALWDVDFDALGTQLTGGKYWTIGPLLGCLAVYFWLKAQRWAALLAPLGRYTWWQVTPALLIGFGGNNVLPAHLGELIRTAVFARQFRKPLSGVFVSQILERILDVIAILVLCFGAVVTVREAPQALRWSAWVVAGLTAGVCAGIGLMLLRPSLVQSLWDRTMGWLPAGLHARGRGALGHAIEALASLTSPSSVAVLLANSLLQWGVMAFTVWLALWAYGTTVSLSVTVIVLAVLALAVTVPSAPGYVGAIQAGFVFALGPFGVAQETAFAASVYFFVAQWVPVTAAGAWFFVASGLSVDQVRHDVEEAEESES